MHFKDTEALQRFDQFFQTFRKTKLWEAMVNTREDSPWHREENVGVHTQMLVRWYMENLAAHRADTQRVLTLTACVFHDVGKPPAEIIKHSEERGTYRAYHGHELISARLWTDFAMSHPEMVREDLQFSLMDIANVAMMIEHHVPFQLKDPQKKLNLKRGMWIRMGEFGHQAWLDLLNSDQHGRISDDQPTKLAAVAEWLEDWEKVPTV
jgi:hypothetical protein